MQTGVRPSSQPAGVADVCPELGEVPGEATGLREQLLLQPACEGKGEEGHRTLLLATGGC